ncbi:MAG: YggT family protein [Gemmatimonadota bacterium]
MLSVIDVMLAVLRPAFFVVAAVAAVVCLVDWLVRTRRVNPFGPAARFARRSVDPLIAPIERSVVRAGGLPSSAPLWALGAVVIIGILVLTLLGFIRNQVVMASFMADRGPAGIAQLVISWVVGILQLALIVRVVSSWIRVSQWSVWVRWAFVLTEPLIAPLRRVIPPLGMIDVTPLVAWVLLIVLERLILGLL